ncbi:DegT/DnrJ/EryC1/StrS family aminotransferase [uncultured Thalassospira sp.]|jgi:dTDP-4-amino-4,6-dideoxygalactose transaminase|uniref:DegT/DnrJ/EryC1/StrS family aminotransferase n=1 Tax=uncultured Thalassospira sp. TaxID=404382 RepID=UPI0032B14B71|tara:strand:- start:3158 stop:4288 length:1131 start_codon:yes stop_codon:yes gene_type:complete
MEFIDLKAQYASIKANIDLAIKEVLDAGHFIQGAQVGELERKMAAHSGVRNVVTCANGTDALVVVLRAWGIGPGDAVVVPSFTFAASAEAVCLVGAVPLFVDVDLEDFNVKPDCLADAVRLAFECGLKPKAVIPVDLFGAPACKPEFVLEAKRLNLRVLLDAAQSYGAKLAGKMTVSLADAATTSFFPAKPLGCYGDGGAIFTEDDDLAKSIRSICVHGKGSSKYENRVIGCNSRLDTIQAAILLEKLSVFDEELRNRQRIAFRYIEKLSSIFAIQKVNSKAVSAWAQFTIRTERRTEVLAACQSAGIPTQIYYPTALADQIAYAHYPQLGALPNSRRLANQVFSIPMHPYLSSDDQTRVCRALHKSIHQISAVED